MGADPVAKVQAQFPGWRVWAGIGGLVYARRLNSSPPVVLRAHNCQVLRARLTKRDAEIRARLGLK